MEMKGVLGDTCNLQVQKREYEGEDVYKSLDSIVTERGYVKPPSYKSGGDNSLPITGRGRGRGRVAALSRIDPMSNSLDDMIIKPSSSTSGRDSSLSAAGRARAVVTSSNLDPMTHSLDDITVRPSSRKPGRNNSLSVAGRAVVASTSTLDPMSNSLDDVIRSRKAPREENGGRGPYDRKKRFREEYEGNASRNEEDDSTNDKDRGKRRRFTGKLTPYRAVTFLSEKLMIIEVKCGMKVEFTEENTPQKWRCVVSCGSLEGIADSSRKVVAREMASQEFLKLLKEAYPDGKIPEYELPPEILLDPKVYKAIEQEGEEAGTNVTFEMSMENKFGDLNGGRLPFFKCVYYMNGSEFFGRSTDRNFAQLKAAGKVYETMTGEKFPETKYFTGSDCDPTVEYDFSESEVHSFAVASAGMVTDEKMD